MFSRQYLLIFLVFAALNGVLPSTDKVKTKKEEVTGKKKDKSDPLTPEIEVQEDYVVIAADPENGKILKDLKDLKIEETEDSEGITESGGLPGPSTSSSTKVTGLSEVFVEFTPEKKTERELDPKAEVLYQNALKLLERKRWGAVEAYDLNGAYKDMEEAAQLGHLDAKKILGFSYLFGENRWSIDEARQIFEELAGIGSADGHLGLGFIYSTGLGLEQPDLARGLLHYTVSAWGGNPLAEMALGYRYYNGIGVNANCDAALTWYKRVGQKVADKVKLTGSPSVQRIRIPEEFEASGGSDKLLNRNIFNYYTYLAGSGDIQSTLALAQLHLTGGKGVPMDLEASAKYFLIAAEAGNTQAFAYLGRMYLEGTPSTPQSNSTALQYFKKAADKGNAIAQSGLGLMFLNGYGVKQDVATAFKLFNMAAEQGSSDGQLHLGQMYFHGIGVEKNYKNAIKYFQLASQSGHILALYNLAYIHATGVGVQRSCSLATELMKNVAERGRWAERFVDAFTKYQLGNFEESAIRYLFLAEFGYEVAQSNFAHILDKMEPKKQQLFAPEETYQRAYQYWLRSANQDYAYARIKLGDYLYYGLGTTVDLAAAANHYKVAATVHQNAQALFNLAYMHEQGLGVSRDLHLAKRFYDLAAETSTDAIAPVTLALLKLRFLFVMDYFVQKFFLAANLTEFLEETFGNQWDLYLMTVFFGLAIWLAIVYWHMKRQQQAQAPPPQPNPVQPAEPQ